MLPATYQHLYDFRQHDNGIYEFVFLDSAKATVDAWINQVELITDAYATTDIVRFLVDTSRATVPVTHTLLRSQQYVRYHPRRPRTRTGVVYSARAPRSTTSILNLFLYWLHGNAHEKAFFAPDNQRDQVIEWLLRDD